MQGVDIKMVQRINCKAVFGHILETASHPRGRSLLLSNDPFTTTGPVIGVHGYVTHASRGCTSRGAVDIYEDTLDIIVEQILPEDRIREVGIVDNAILWLPKYTVHCFKEVTEIIDFEQTVPVISNTDDKEVFMVAWCNYGDAKNVNFLVIILNISSPGSIFNIWVDDFHVKRLYF
ncbi:hypothetical protein EDD15DRAFT_2195242 [Pisolithus albus]|nr:hypothetical protein EDD15DRAFT_2195242 [Pisolithus albus]